MVSAKNIFSFITPEIVRDLGIDYAFVGLIHVGNSIAYMVFSFLSGILCSILGAPLLISVSAVFGALCTISLSAVHTPWMVLLMISLINACSACLWVAALYCVTVCVRDENRGKAAGIVGSGFSAGVILDGILIPIVLAHRNWTHVWLYAGLLSLAIALCGTVCLYVLRKQGFQMPAPARKERRKSVLTNWRSFGKTHWLLLLLLLLTGMAFQPLQSYVVSHMQEDLGLGTAVSGLARSLIGMAGVFSGVLGGILVDKTNARTGMLLLNGAAVLALGLAAFGTGAAVLLAACVLYGFGYNAVTGVHPIYTARVLPAEEVSGFWGILNVTLGFGAMIGSYVTGLLQTMLGGFSGAFLTLFVVSGLTILICLFLYPDRVQGAANAGNDRQEGVG